MYSKSNNNQINPELTFFSELEQLLPPSKTIKNVSRSQLNLLKYFIESPNTILYDIKNKENLKEQVDNRYKSLKILLEKKLLTETDDIIRKRKIYKVSNTGLFYFLKKKHLAHKIRKNYYLITKIL